VLSGLLRDAVLLAERGTATPADIDTAMRLGAGHPAGPFEVLAGLTPEQRRDRGLPADLPAASVPVRMVIKPPRKAVRGRPRSPGDRPWPAVPAVGLTGFEPATP
jgi:3-hydroxyacyl-CoA dehydrogenase-like protein